MEEMNDYISGISNNNKIDEEVIEKITVGDEEKKSIDDSIPYYYSSIFLPGVRMSGDISIAVATKNKFVKLCWYTFFGTLVYGLLPILFWPKENNNIYNDKLFVFSYYYGLSIIVIGLILRFVVKFNNEKLDQSNYFQKTVKFQVPPESKTLYELEQKDSVCYKVMKAYVSKGDISKYFIANFIVIFLIQAVSLILMKNLVLAYFITILYLVVMWSGLWFGFARKHTSLLVEKAHNPKLFGYAHAKYWVSIREDYIIFPLVHQHLPVVINNGFISYDSLSDYGYDKYSVLGLETSAKLVDYSLWMKTGERIQFKISSAIADKIDFFLDKKVKKITSSLEAGDVKLASTAVIKNIKPKKDTTKV